MSPVLKLVSSDAQLAQQLRETGMQCVVVARDTLSTLAQPGARQPEAVSYTHLTLPTILLV